MMIPVVRNVVEYAVLFAIWGVTHLLIHSQVVGNTGLLLLVLASMWAKSVFFGAENLQQLWFASRQNMAYHRFMVLMLVNMSQIITSFALDYHCLHCINSESFSGINPEFNAFELVFEFFYFSVLNFTFFGYGDITPMTVPAKLVTMTEVVLAFVTVIFLLSDFISLKDSIGRPKDEALK